MNPFPHLSVVIPTRDRSEILERTLDDVLDLADPGVEVVVVDDGSRDDTRDLLQSKAVSRPQLRFLTQENRGPAAARNRGVEAAAGRRVLLLGDDTRPGPETLGIHMRGEEEGIQGYIEWDPEIEVTPVMRFLAPAGPQFYFSGLEEGKPVPYTAILGSNLSAPRSWFLEEPYDESFPYAAFEDTELAKRWSHRGWITLFRRGAVCFHRHSYSELEEFLDRQRRAGAAARHAVRRHPGMLGRVVVWPMVVGILRVVSWLGRRSVRRHRSEDEWDLRCRWSFLAGFLGLGSE